MTGGDAGIASRASRREYSSLHPSNQPSPHRKEERPTVLGPYWDSAIKGSARPNPNVDPITMFRLPNLLMSHPAAGMARTEPIAAIINDLPKTAGERWRCA